MALIKSISGIRGTIGGQPGQALTPVDAVAFAAAYGSWLKETYSSTGRIKVVLGRDARPSGPFVQGLVENTLLALGIDVIDLDLSTTPTVEMEVVTQGAQGGIILTASHNPVNWNALKLLNHRGEFISAADGQALLERVATQEYSFVEVQELGTKTTVYDAMERHVEAVLQLPLVDVPAIRACKFKIVVDAVNSTGGIAVPLLLDALGCEVEELYCAPNGQFPHNPEPLKEHLGEICRLVPAVGAHLGIVVDPDVDRLALIDETGEMFGEEYTLVAVADYVLDRTPGPAVSNLSSSRALRDVALGHQCLYRASAVGEVNVVETMKELGAVIGGEGNGGIIYPELHYGRDSLVGIALFLTHLAYQGGTVSALRRGYPAYFMAKKKAELDPAADVDAALARIADRYKEERVTTVDGVKIDFQESWVHLRKSNTEPIVRIYTEAPSQTEADALADRFIAAFAE